MPTCYPCRICNKPVANNHKAIQCGICDHWVHIKCNKLSADQYEALTQDESQTWCCISCIKECIPYDKCNDEMMQLIIQGKNPSDNLIESQLEDHHLIKIINDIDGITFDEDLPVSNAYFTLSELNNIDTKTDTINAFSRQCSLIRILL